MSKSKKAILITSIVVLVTVPILVTGIIYFGFYTAPQPDSTSISYDKLSTVMEDDIVYLSDDFLTLNNLERVGFLGNADYADHVRLSYNRKKVVNCPDFSARVENIDASTYNLSSKADNDGIPVNVEVGFLTRKDKNHKYNQEYNGYKYCTDIVLDNKLIYYIKTTPRKGATCIMSLIIEVREDVASKYTEEEKNARIEQIFKSAVDNIVYYDEL